MANYMASGVDDDDRRWPRIRVAVPASIVVGDQGFLVKLTNIANGGAMLDTTSELNVGTSVTFQCGTVAAEATVIWARPGKIGISFPVHLTDGEVAEQLSRSAAIEARRAMEPSKSALNGRPHESNVSVFEGSSSSR